jgi:mannose/fructose/N-acetylgalactosamine-specific phosphotransferase system component IIC
MPADATTWILLALLGGWVAADSTGLGQLMISRPLVAATLAGWLAGSPLAGAFAGLVLEVFHLTVLPVGAARYPEAGPAAVVVGAVFAASDQRALTLLTAVVFSLVWESLSGSSVRGFRKINSRLLGSAREVVEDPDAERSLERRHLTALALDVLRGAVLVVVGIVLLHLLLGVIGASGVTDDDVARTVLRLSVVLLLASALRLFGRRIGFVAAGMAAGLLLVLLRA